MTDPTSTIEALPSDTDEKHDSSASWRAPADITVAVCAAWSLIGTAELSTDAAVIAAGVELRDWPTLDLSNVAEAIRSLVKSGAPVDPLTIADHLRRHGYDPMLAELHRAFVDTPSVSSAAYYAGIVGRDARHRRLVELAARLGAAALDGDDRRVEEVLAAITEEVPA